jgi:hypothetical protein
MRFHRQQQPSVEWDCYSTVKILLQNAYGAKTLCSPVMRSITETMLITICARYR